MKLLVRSQYALIIIGWIENNIFSADISKPYRGFLHKPCIKTVGYFILFHRIIDISLIDRKQIIMA